MEFEKQHKRLSPNSTFDAILVPGGGVRTDGDLPHWVKLRLDAALDLARGIPIITLSAGTTHRVPPIEPNGWPLLEAVAMARYLESRGYPPHLVWAEAASYDTIGNAYFARMVHVEPARLRRLLIITSTFHLPRTEKIFRWIYSLDPPAQPFELTFLDTSNTGMSHEVLHARIEKEISRIATLENTIRQHQSIISLHNWLFTEHAAYAVSATFRREQARDKLLDSY